MDKNDKIETGKIDTSKIDTSKIDTSKIDTSKIDTIETDKIDQSKMTEKEYGDYMDELHFNTRPRDHKTALRAWLNNYHGKK
jgi:hypothetical protein